MDNATLGNGTGGYGAQPSKVNSVTAADNRMLVTLFRLSRPSPEIKDKRDSEIYFGELTNNYITSNGT